MLTPWGEALDREAPLPEHPRPQLVRGDWLNLNGPWQYALHETDQAGRGPLDVADPTAAPAAWDGEIVVPFSPETPLSGVGRTLGPDGTLWYRRRFALPRALRPGERVLLHLGAVDQSCRVAVDGVEVGAHTGGFLPFSLDVTAALAGGQGEHEITVAVRDVTDSSWLARGKQSSRRGGIWYTPQSGIWQTVWLEIVPRVAVDGLELTPVGPGVPRELDVLVRSEHAPAGATARVEVVLGEIDAAVPDERAAGEPDDGGSTVLVAEVPVGAWTRLTFPGPVRAWSPEDPFLYGLDVRLGEDRVTSYVGMRTFGRGRDAAGHERLLLNGEPYLHVGLLDQGYWPDGGLTAPSDAALAYDVVLAKELGYTMLRKHIKIEPLRWYYHCDRLGMLVWQDAVNGGRTYRARTVSLPAVMPFVRLRDDRYRTFGREDAEGRASYEAETRAMVEHLRSVPSIALWVVFNEGWGQFDALRVSQLVRELDPTRPLDHASGWHDQGGGDLRSWHVYFRRVRAPRRPDGRVFALTEYGGYSWTVPGAQWGERVFGYRRYRDGEALARAVENLHDRQLVPAVRRGLAATVYTQLSDVEDEVNGLVTYDRRTVKIPAARVRAMNDRLRAAAARTVEEP